MLARESKPYGSWSSPITPESLSSGAAATDVCIDNGYVYWCESVSSERGRGQIFRQPIQQADSVNPTPLLPLEYDCRTRVHEYGLGAFKVSNGLVIFSNMIDNRLYTMQQRQNKLDVQPLTAANPYYRYADFAVDKAHRFVVCVREEHFENEEPKDVVNVLVSIDLSNGHETVIAKGEDFYSFPRLSGQNDLAYICWSHPNMPWDFTRLYLAKTEFKDQALTLKDIKCVAGDKIEESISQPEFGIDNTLYFASDRSGFWNLYSYKPAIDNEVHLLLDKPLEQEFVGPAWRFNSSTYAPLRSNPHQLIVINKTSLAVLDTRERSMRNLKCSYDHFSDIRIYYNAETNNEYIISNMSSTTEPRELFSYDIAKEGIVFTHQRSAATRLNPEYISIGQEIQFPTTDGQYAYCYYYAPKNPEYEQSATGLPPLRVLSHGGPTAATSNSYNRAIQYWTTRGFAIADVNYGGSTGYGRNYRNRLQLKWGIVDVDDCCNAALYLADKGLVDRNKLAIEGGSAGGYTTLASLAFRNVFKAGCCQYGISDLTLLLKETHKFESRYPDRLVGEYPKDKQVYYERSPLHKAEDIRCPVIFFQGADDKVVPPSQAEVMVTALKEKGVPVAYVLYEGEGHGFRRAENIKRTMELEQWFYGQIFDFPVEGVEGVEIYNFHKWI